MSTCIQGSTQASVIFCQSVPCNKLKHTTKHNTSTYYNQHTSYCSMCLLLDAHTPRAAFTGVYSCFMQTNGRLSCVYTYNNDEPLVYAVMRLICTQISLRASAIFLCVLL